MPQVDLFLERYDKHIQLSGFGLPGQEALTKAKVLVIGAGALGIPVLSYLTAMGISNLGIVEHSLISLPDLPLQPLYKYNQVGEAKMECMVQHLRDVNPEAKLQLYDYALNADNALEIIAQYDVVVDATNDIKTGLLVNDACVITKIPLVIGFAHKYAGQLSVLNFKGSATLRCMLADPSVQDYLPTDKEPGLLGILPGIIGCYMAAEAVKIMGSIGDVLSNKLVIIDLLKTTQQTVKLTLNPANLKITSLQQPDIILEDAQTDKKIQSMTPHQLSLKLDYQESVQLIDIRELHEWNFCHISNATHLPASNLLSNLNKIHQDIPVVLISHRGTISRNITDLLLEKYGYGNIYSLTGGINAWAQEVDKSMPTY